jgi:hypothetical protein
MSVTYGIAGSDGWVVVAAGSVVLFTPGTDADLVTTLWDTIRSTDPVQSCLEALTRRGLNSAPPFVMADWSGAPGSDAVVLARGGASAAVTTPTGPALLDGRSVTTWLEQRVASVSAIVLGDRASASRSLALESGVAFASWVEVGVAAAPAPAVASAPAVTTARPEATAAATDLPAAPPTPSAGDAAEVEVEIAVEAAGAPDPKTITSLPEAATAVPESTITELPDAAGGYAHLFEETVVRNIEDAAVRPPTEGDHEDGEHEASDRADDEKASPTPDAGSEVADGDHDGLTVMSGDLAELRKARKGVAPPTAPREAQPVLSYYLDVSTGGREPLVHSVLVGRSPSVSKISSGQVPRLITIPGDKDISRNHAQLSLEGGTVVVTDLHSRNGTSVILPGKSPQALRAGEPTPVIPGTIVDLGGGVRLTVIEESE